MHHSGFALVIGLALLISALSLQPAEASCPRKIPVTVALGGNGMKLLIGAPPNVSDCDGLSIMVERLPEQEVQAVATKAVPAARLAP